MILPSKKVLFVSGDARSRSSIADLLTGQIGLRNLITAGSGAKAYDLIVESWKTADRVELIISDWDLTETSGIDLLIKVRTNEELKNLPFVLIVSGDEPFHQAVQAGVSASVEKPVDEQKLRDKIGEAWTRHHGGLNRSSVRKLN